MEYNIRKRNLPLFIAFILFCLTIISLILTGNLLAKYAQESTIDANATVAVMAMDSDYTLQEIYTNPGEDKEILINFTNKENRDICEVTQQYTAELKPLTDNIPLTYDMYKLENGRETKVNEMAGNFTGGLEEVDTYKLKIKWPEELQPAEMSFEIDAFLLSVDATQVD